MTLFATVLDERIKCAVISGYLNRFESFALNRGNFCGAQLPLGLLKYGEMEDVACLIAPRPLLIESATGDSGFPIEASRRASDTVRRAYAAAEYPSASMSMSSMDHTSGAAPRHTTGWPDGSNRS